MNHFTEKEFENTVETRSNTSTTKPIVSEGDVTDNLIQSKNINRSSGPSKDEKNNDRADDDANSISKSSNNNVGAGGEELLLSKLPENPESLGKLTELQCIPKDVSEMKNLYLPRKRVHIPSEFDPLSNLESLKLDRSHLTSIPSSLGYLQNLKFLDLSFNRLSELPFGNEMDDLQSDSFKNLKVLPQLQILDCSVNCLKSIPKRLCTDATNLYRLELKRNCLTLIPAEIGNWSKLDRLNINDNLIESLPPEIGNLQSLRKLYCAGNRLTSLPFELSMLSSLIGINYSANPIEYIPPNLRRVLDNQIKIYNSIYTDTQNVHDSHIQKCITESINRVITIPPLPEYDNFEKVRNYVIEDEVFEEDVKEIILEYCDNPSIHSELGLTFVELLVAVISRIEVLGKLQKEQSIHTQDEKSNGKYNEDDQRSQIEITEGARTNRNSTYTRNIEEKEKNIKWHIKRVINDVMKDSLCKCFTGRMSRLIGSLNGFDDLVEITISPQKQISNIIVNIKNILQSENKYTVEIHRERTRKELEERGFDNELIMEYIGYIE